MPVPATYHRTDGYADANTEAKPHTGASERLYTSAQQLPVQRVLVQYAGGRHLFVGVLLGNRHSVPAPRAYTDSSDAGHANRYPITEPVNSRSALGPKLCPRRSGSVTRPHPRQPTELDAEPRKPLCDKGSRGGARFRNQQVGSSRPSLTML